MPNADGHDVVSKHVMVLDGTLSDADLEHIVAVCQLLAKSVREPKQALANVFEPYSNFNGGYYTKTARHMRLLCSIALGVEMAAKIVEFREKGTIQAQGFAELLGNAGLGGDVVSMLTATHATQTPEESAQVAARELVELAGGQVPNADGHDVVSKHRADLPPVTSIG